MVPEDAGIHYCPGLTPREIRWTYYKYVPIEDFETFQTRQGRVCIQLGRVPHYNQERGLWFTPQLSHEELTELNPTVGFVNDSGDFEYHKYTEWSSILGVRASNREELLTITEGKPPQWKK